MLRQARWVSGSWFGSVFVFFSTSPEERDILTNTEVLMLKCRLSFRQFYKVISANSPTVGQNGTKAVLKAIPNVTV